MIKTLKDYIDDFSVLPNFVKGFIYIAVLILILVIAYQTGSNILINRKVEKLEKQNIELQKKSDTALKTAETYAKIAADEHIRAENLSSQIPKLNKEIKQSDEKIYSQTKKSDSIRRDLDNVRRSKPKRISPNKLETELCKRYGNCKTGNN